MFGSVEFANDRRLFYVTFVPLDLRRNHRCLAIRPLFYFTFLLRSPRIKNGIVGLFPLQVRCDQFLLRLAQRDNALAYLLERLVLVQTVVP